MTQEAPVTSAPVPPIPRDVTRSVARRAWAEPHVRFWWVAAAMLVLSGLYLLLTQFAGWRYERDLVRNGTVVVAVVKQANEQTLPGRPQKPDALVRLEFDWKGQRRAVGGQLEGRKAGEYIAVDDKVSIRVDPNDPDRWTARTEPPPLVIHLLGALIALALAAMVVPAALGARRRVMRTWRDGVATEARIVARQQTALAPRSTALRCTLAGGEGEGAAADEDRVFTVYVPGRRGDEAVGDLVWVLLRAGGRPLAVEWFS